MKLGKNIFIHCPFKMEGFISEWNSRFEVKVLGGKL